MSLSSDPVLSKLRSQYVCGVRDITGEPWAGVSGTHATNGQAFLAKNGAGPHNLQLFILAPDGTVLHCLPGYWDARDLAGELDLAQQLYQVYRRTDLTVEEKAAIFRSRQLAHVQAHPGAMTARSRMESFDMKYEARKRPETSDTITTLRFGADGKPLPSSFKTTDVIVHERMAQRPFVKYEAFDVESFSDYGRPKYDKKEDSRAVKARKRTSRR